MKKFIIPLIIVIVAVFIVGNTAQKENTSNLTIENNESDTQRVFEAKEECSSYESNIRSKMKETSWSSYTLDEIFYSPVKNSCLYSIIAKQEKRQSPYTAFIIWDYFTDEMILYRDTTLTNNQNLLDIYENAQLYLKGQAQFKYTEEDWKFN